MIDPPPQRGKEASMSEVPLSRSALVGKVLARYLMALVFLSALFFVPAGTLAYWQGWFYLALLFLPMAGVGVWLLRNDPALLERRLRMRERESAQKRIIGLSYLGFLAAFVLPGLDHRFGWSQMPAWVALAAGALVLLGYGITAWVFRTNSYAARTVAVDAGQQVIRSGPYALVRHPMYVGFGLLMLVSPLALGSYWAVIPALSIVPVLVARITNEEVVLARDLLGYTEYMQAVRWRLLPGIW
jgi:protein-S-isoprenylcysteine O-methyltransferase Ste14